ncbi:MAG: hypothetical protein V4612_05665 [Pseudomonadota bacterium]
MNNNFKPQLDVLSREFEAMLDNDKSQSNSAQIVQTMLKKIDDFLFAAKNNGNVESLKEFLKKELNLKSDADIQNFVTSAPDQLKNY